MEIMEVEVEKLFEQKLKQIEKLTFMHINRMKRVKRLEMCDKFVFFIAIILITVCGFTKFCF